MPWRQDIDNHYADSTTTMMSYESQYTHNYRITAIKHTSGLISGLRPANERRRYKVTPSLIGWAQTQNQPCIYFARETSRVDSPLVPLLWGGGGGGSFPRNNRALCHFGTGLCYETTMAWTIKCMASVNLLAMRDISNLSIQLHMHFYMFVFTLACICTQCIKQ